jgi:hypothetical protein
MWKPSAITSGRCASSLSSASAGGQEEQPCEVNSSTTTGRALGACRLCQQCRSGGGQHREHGFADPHVTHFGSWQYRVARWRYSSFLSRGEGNGGAIAPM